MLQYNDASSLDCEQVIAAPKPLGTIDCESKVTRQQQTQSAYTLLTLVTTMECSYHMQPRSKAHLHA